MVGLNLIHLQRLFKKAIEMIVRLLWTIWILYCVMSYLFCAYTLWTHRDESIFNEDINITDRILTSFLFMIVAPITVGGVIIHQAMKDK